MPADYWVYCLHINTRIFSKLSKWSKRHSDVKLIVKQNIIDMHTAKTYKNRRSASIRRKCVFIHWCCIVFLSRLRVVSRLSIIPFFSSSFLFISAPLCTSYSNQTITGCSTGVDNCVNNKVPVSNHQISSVKVNMAIQIKRRWNVTTGMYLF